MQITKTKVLVVDDDIASLETLTRLLQHFGFEVVSESDSGRALAILQGFEEFAALVCDFEMPGINGGQLARAAKLTRPTMSVFVFSGTYPPDASPAPWDGWFLKGAAITELIHKLQTFKNLADSAEKTCGNTSVKLKRAEQRSFLA